MSMAKEHGTPSGYRDAHVGTEKCVDCLAAHRLMTQDIREARARTSRGDPIPHGTLVGYRQHLREKSAFGPEEVDEVCDECRRVKLNQNRLYRDRVDQEKKWGREKGQGTKTVVPVSGEAYRALLRMSGGRPMAEVVAEALLAYELL